MKDNIKITAGRKEMYHREEKCDEYGTCLQFLQI